jgi:hypothetical protein
MESGNPTRTGKENKKSQGPSKDRPSKPFEAAPVEEIGLDPRMPGIGSTQKQSAMLERLDRPQRQQLVAQIGRVQGNQHVQRLLEPTKISRQRRHVSVKLAQSGDGQVISRREATWVERRAWLSFFDHYLPRRFLNNYMDDTGAEITLTQQEMVDCNPVVNLRRSRDILNEVERLRRAGGGSVSISARGTGGAMTNGTLGNFTINYSGELTVTADGGWQFQGTMSFYDFWDFDPKPFGSGSGRPAFAEIRVRAAHYGLPGRPFHIRSEEVPVSQTSRQSGAAWAGGTPVGVTGPMGRAASDVGAGADVGGGADVAGGPGAMDVGVGAGSDVGANTAEDFNP